MKGFTAVASMLLLLVVPAPGASARPKPVQPADLSGLTAKSKVKDRIIKERKLVGASGANVQVFLDQHGHRITLATDIPGLDLTAHAAILAGTLHYQEIEDVVVEVVPPEQIGALCGSPAAMACYLADDPVNSFKGQIWIPSTHPDLEHILTHEYGHHVDNQLVNLGHFGGACGFDNDGSRNWFFQRDVEDDILGSGITCDPGSNWDTLLGELYAEDYVSANGFSGWVLPTVQPPTSVQLEALKFDFENPFAPRTRRWNPMVAKKRARYKRIRSDAWTFLTVSLTGRRKADLDLYLFKGNSSRSLKRSRRLGSRERIEYVLEPFVAYDIGVYAYKSRGRGRVTIYMD